jgi:hypothetical protein
VSTKVSFSKLGLACHIAKIHSEVYYNNNSYGNAKSIFCADCIGVIFLHSITEFGVIIN